MRWPPRLPFAPQNRLGAGNARCRQPIWRRVCVARSVQFEHESQCLVDRGEFADRELTHELAQALRGNG